MTISLLLPKPWKSDFWRKKPTHNGCINYRISATHFSRVLDQLYTILKTQTQPSGTADKVCVNYSQVPRSSPAAITGLRRLSASVTRRHLQLLEENTPSDHKHPPYGANPEPVTSWSSTLLLCRCVCSNT